MHIFIVYIITVKRFDKIILNSFFEMSLETELNAKCEEGWTEVGQDEFYMQRPYSWQGHIDI
jgi:hypothetical protein